MFKIADYNIIKILGKGAYGIVFLVSKDGVEYALKFQKTLEKHIKYNSRSKQWREIIFSDFFKKKTPLLLTMYDYGFCEKKNYNEIKYTIEDNWSYEHKKLFEELNESNFFSYIIYELRTDSLQNIEKYLTIEQKYTLILQLTVLIQLLNQHGFYHNDIHLHNIMFERTNEPSITVNNTKIPTLGFVFTLIDYGENTHIEYELTPQERSYMTTILSNENTEVTSIIRLLLRIDQLYSLMQKNNMTIPYLSDFGKEIQKCGEYSTIIETINPKDSEMVYYYFACLNFKHFVNLHNIDESEHSTLLPISDILFSIHNRGNISKIINYFLHKIDGFTEN